MFDFPKRDQISSQGILRERDLKKIRVLTAAVWSNYSCEVSKGINSMKTLKGLKVIQFD